jgi:hypothetical protein
MVTGPAAFAHGVNLELLNLMDREHAKIEFEKLYSTLKPKVHLPLNKQKGEKKHHAYLTGIVNMLTEQALSGLGLVKK